MEALRYFETDYNRVVHHLASRSLERMIEHLPILRIKLLRDPGLEDIDIIEMLGMENRHDRPR